jgi:hypothetical protein
MPTDRGWRTSPGPRRLEKAPAAAHPLPREREKPILTNIFFSRPIGVLATRLKRVLFGPQRFRRRNQARSQRRYERGDQRRERERQDGKKNHPGVIRIQSVELAT